MENLQLIFQQDKVLQTSSFDLEGISNNDKDERRQSIYEGLVSPDGLSVSVRKKLEDKTEKEVNLIFRFYIQGNIAILRMYDSKNKQIGYVGSPHFSERPDQVISNVSRYYGEDLWLGSKSRHTDDSLLYREEMKKKYESHGIMKAATVCFQLALEANNAPVTLSTIKLNNLASLEAHKTPDIENLTFRSAPEEYSGDGEPNYINLITRTVRT